MIKRIALLLVIATLSACSRKPEATTAKAAEPLTVKVATVEVRTVENSISVTGSLWPDETITASSEVAGRIKSIHVDFGQRVRKGEILAELDTHELSLQAERSRAALAQALARVGLKPGQENAVPESTPAIRQVTAQVEDARFKYENAAKLVKSGDVSQDRFNELEKAFLARQASLEAARDELRVQLAGIQALSADAKLAAKRLADATLRAPFDGAVTARSASPGQYMKENTPILTLVKTHPLRLRLEIPESASAGMRLGATLSFTTDAAPGVEFRAVVRELNPALDMRSRSFSVEARLTGDEEHLRPGTFVQVRLVTAKAAEIVAVPKAAIYNVAGLTKIFVIRDGKAVEQKIPPGREIDGWVEVPPGVVRAGEQVAVSDQGVLVDGSAVSLTTKAQSAQRKP